MAIGDRTYPWAAHTAWGKLDNLQQNVIEHTFAYTYHKKKISVATAGAVLSSTAGTTSQQVISANIMVPDVPRVLAITLGGSGFSAGKAIITGVNIEGKTITDTISYSSSTGQTLGLLVFKRVTSVTVPGSLGASATFTIDTTNKIGLNHRIPSGFGTVIEIKETQTSPYPNFTKPTLQAAPSSSNFDGEFVEKNWVTSASAYDGTTSRVYYYWFHKALVYPPKDSPEFYSTTTSTSTSSTSTSTSISSTSTSISTTTSLSTSTSTSISSTSTSTTTLPV